MTAVQLHLLAEWMEEGGGRGEALFISPEHERERERERERESAGGGGGERMRARERESYFL